jgi:hypothetical protein
VFKRYSNPLHESAAELLDGPFATYKIDLHNLTEKLICTTSAMAFVLHDCIVSAELLAVKFNLW